MRPGGAGGESASVRPARLGDQYEPPTRRCDCGDVVAAGGRKRGVVEGDAQVSGKRRDARSPKAGIGERDRARPRAAARRRSRISLALGDRQRGRAGNRHHACRVSAASASVTLRLLPTTWALASSVAALSVSETRASDRHHARAARARVGERCGNPRSRDPRCAGGTGSPRLPASPPANRPP